MSKKQREFDPGVKDDESDVTHMSDCAVHNIPAEEAGECDCGAIHSDMLEKVTRPDVLEDEDDLTAGIEEAAAMESPEDRETVVPTAIKTPTTFDGFQVLDADGNQIAICGFGHNRKSSGPGIAAAVSGALNRYGRGAG